MAAVVVADSWDPEGRDGQVLKNIPNWQGNTPTPHQLIMMAGGTIGGKEALDLVPPGDLGTLLERTVVHQLEVKKRHDRNYGERAKQLLEDLPVGGLVLFTDGGSNKIRSQTGWGVVVLQKNAAAQHPTVVAELFGPVETSPFNPYYIGALDKTNNTAELTAAYQALLYLHNAGGLEPALIVADSEVALNAMDGYRALFEGVPETPVQASGTSVNVVITMTVRRLYSAEQQRRGAAALAHVHSHTGDYANDRADSLANIGKGIGPYSQQLPIPLRLYGGVGISESDEDRDARIQTGDGYPHEAVPGKYCCVWATPEQVQKVGLAVQSAQPPLGRRKGYRTQQPPDFGSGVKGFGATKYTDFVGSLSGPPDRIASSRTIRVMQAPPIKLEKLEGTVSEMFYQHSLAATASTYWLYSHPLEEGGLDWQATMRSRTIDRCDAVDAFAMKLFCCRKTVEYNNEYLDGWDPDSEQSQPKCSLPFLMRNRRQMKREGQTWKRYWVAETQSWTGEVRPSPVRKLYIKEEYGSAARRIQRKQLFVQHLTTQQWLSDPTEMASAAAATLETMSDNEEDWTDATLTFTTATISSSRTRSRKSSNPRRSGPRQQTAGERLVSSSAVRYIPGGDGLNLGVHSNNTNVGLNMYGAMPAQYDPGTNLDPRGRAREYLIRHGELVSARRQAIPLPPVRLGKRDKPGLADWKSYWLAQCAALVTLADDGMYRRAEIRRMNAALKKSLANGDMIDAAQHRHFLKILMEGAEADTPLVPDQADGSDDDGSSAVGTQDDRDGDGSDDVDSGSLSGREAGSRQSTLSSWIESVGDSVLGPRPVLPVQFTRGGDLQDVSDDDGGESSQVGGLEETQVESLSDEPDPEEQEEEGETPPLTKKNEEDYEFEIEDDEELDEAALAARYRPGGDPSADLLSSM